MKKLIIYFMILILLMTGVFAYTEYESIGQNDFLSEDTGYFNTALDPDDVKDNSPKVPISDPQFIPLISDLDGDGIKEIIVADGDNIKIYQNNSLDSLDAYDTSSTITKFKVYDIDGDGNKNIIFLSEYNFGVLTYNGTLNEDYSGTLSYNPSSGQIFPYLGCFDEECFYFEKTNINIYYSSFNVSGLKVSDGLFYTTTSDGTNYPFNDLPNMEKADYDNDGDDEFILITPSTSGTYYIRYMNETYDIEQSINIGSLSSKDFTSPIVYDFDGFPSNGLETVIGKQIDSNEFKLYIYESDGSLYDDYPEILEADGVLLSNVIRGNFFTDTDDVDFCVLGYATDIEELDLLCGSAQTSGIESKEFNIGTAVNISPTEDFYNIMIHAVQHDNTLVDGNNLNEILTPYGLLSIDYEWDNELIPIFEFGNFFDSANVPVDYNDDDREEIISLTSTNLWYLTDTYETEGVYLMDYSSNPCNTGTIKLNTTWIMSLTPYDTEGDDVSAKVILYYGEANEQDSGWSNNYSSGTTIPIEIFPNATIGTGTIKLMARDTSNPLDILTYTTTFSVSTDGYEFGEVICGGSTTAVTPEETEQEQSVADFEEDLQDAFGGIPLVGGVFSGFFSLAIITLLFILAVSAGTYERTKQPLLAVGVFMILFIIVSIAGLIPIYWVLVVILLFIAIYWLYHMLRGE